MNWAKVLFVLRDGQVALVEAVKWGPWQNVRSGPTKLSDQIVKQLKGTPWENAEELRVTNRQRRTGRVLDAKTVPKSIPNLDEKAKDKYEYVQVRSKPASPEIWESLNNSNSVARMRRALRSLEKYLNRNWDGWIGREFPQDLQRYATGLLAAKKLDNYPDAKQKKRPSSDDKRVIFFSKVLAGLRLSLSPTYATKKLSHCRWEKDWATNPYKEYVERIRSQRGHKQ